MTILKHPEYYTDEEVQLFTDFFISKNNSCKKKFNLYLENFLNVYAQNTKDSEENLSDNKFKNRIQLKDYEYSTSHVKINNENQDNIITFILSSPKFMISNTRMKNLKKLCPDWHYQNNQGNTALHCLASNGESNEIIDLMNEYKIDPSIKNKNGDTFLSILLNPKSFMCYSKDYYSFVYKEITKIEKIAELIEKCQTNFENEPLEKILENKNNFEILKEKLLLHINANKKELYNTNVMISLKEITEFIEKVINYHYLEKSITNTNINNNRKNKI